MWRVRVILAEDGIDGAVDAAVAGLPDTPENRGIKSRWLGPVPAPNFVRSSPLVQGMIYALGASLGLDQAAVDAIIVRANALVE